MATYKKPSGTRSSTPPPPPPETSFSRALGESAQQIWLAGLGALGRAQEEGGRLFDALVREGREVDRSARAQADAETSGLRDGVEATAGEARDQAQAGWERLERVLDSGVQRTLARLGVPTRRDVTELNARIEALTAELRARDAAERREKARAGAGGTPATKRTRRTATGAGSGPASAASATAPTATATPATPKTGSAAATASTAPGAAVLPRDPEST